MSIVVNKTRLPVTQWQTESGSVVSISDARKRYAKSLSVALEPIQDLHGYSAPWVGGAGKQLLDPSTFIDIPAESQGITAINNGDGTFTVKGTATSNAYITLINYQLISDYGFFEPDVSYTLSGYYSGDVYIGFGIYGSGTDYWANSASGKTMTFTAEQIASKRYRVIIYVHSGTVLGDTGIVLKPMICKSSAQNPATFAPYENLCPISGHSSVTAYRAGANQSDNPQSVTLSLGQTVYGGSVDLVSGVLTVTHGCYTITGSERWNTNSFNINRYYSIAYLLRGIAKLPVDNNSSVPIQTSIGNFNDSYNSMQYTNGKMCIATDGRIGINANLYDLYGGTEVLKDVQIVYELATPITIQLTPAEIEMLMRNNTVWSDAGLITLNYARIRQ